MWQLEIIGDFDIEISRNIEVEANGGWVEEMQNRSQNVGDYEMKGRRGRHFEWILSNRI